MSLNNQKKIRTYNKISSDGLKNFSASDYSVSDTFNDADAILLRSHQLLPSEIPNSILAIARAGAGVNNIPVDWCTDKGIPVFNTPGANANAVKELVAAGLLIGARGIIEGSAFSRSLTSLEDKHQFKKNLEENKSKFKGEELAGKTLGVVGLGAIGSLVAEMALMFGMNVIGYDPKISIEAAWRLSSKVKRADDLTSLIVKSDYLTLHLPVTESTKNIINRDFLSHCKRNVCLLNFARPHLIDLEALGLALQEGRIRKYVSDFPEPSLLGHEGVIFFPHIGASTKEAEVNCAIMAVEQLKNYMERGNVRNSVNFPDVDLQIVEGCRLSVTNQNVPKILGSVLSVLANENLNVIDMLNKSRDRLAYNIIDLDRSPSISSLDMIRNLRGVSNVRIVSSTVE